MFLQNSFAVFDVFVPEDFDRGARKPRAVNDRSVIQLVGNNQIVFPQDRRNGSGVTMPLPSLIRTCSGSGLMT